jgi:outer membrane protein
MSCRRSLAALGCAVIGLATAGSVESADLLSVYERARQEDPQFAQARAEYRAAREQWPQARAAVLPQVNVTASTSEVESRDNIDNSTVGFDEDTYGLELRQPLFDWEAFAGLDRADAAVAQAEAEFAGAQQDLITRVAEAYFDVLAARDGVRFARAEKRAVERQLDQARQRFEVGLIPITDVKEAQASFDLAVSRELEAQNQLDRAREALRTITGRVSGELEGADDSVPLASPDPADPERWVGRAIGQNPDYLAARSATEVARHAMRQSRDGYYPEIDLVVSRNNTQSSFTQGVQPIPFDQTNDRIGVELSWNLFAGGATESRGDQTRAEFQGAQAALTESRRRVQQQTRDAYRAVETAIAQVRALRQAVESNQARVEATRSGFRVGTRTSVDVLNAVRDLYRAQRDLADARYNYIISRLQLKRAAGNLTLEDVRRIDGWLSASDSTIDSNGNSAN